MESNQRKDLLKIFQAGLKAVDPEEAIRRHVRRDGTSIHVDDSVYDLNEYRRVLLVGAGKGTAPMAKALEDILGDHLESGLIVVKYDHGMPLGKTRIVEAGHPIPDAAGVRGAREILELLQAADDKDLVVAAFSGGGSALLPAPVPPLELEHKQETTRLLLECGATIDEINALRKHLSLVKGGGLARAAAPAQVVSLILSDVIGDRLDVIASGPIAPDPSTYAECLEIVRRHGIADRLPVEVRDVLEEGASGKRPETPKPGDPLFSMVQNVIVGSNFTALMAAREQAESLGYRTLVLTSRLEGEAREVARAIVAIAKEVSHTGNPLSPPACLLFGGETTVTLTGDGKGGRNQELALACVVAMEGWNSITVLSAGTDGTDGPTDAAGAFADGATVERARALGLDPRDFLARNDAYHFFAPLGDLCITGPTRTNVMDMICVLIQSLDRPNR